MNLSPAQMMNRTMGSLGIKLNLQTRDRIYGFLLTLPALLVVFGLIFYPLGLGILNSFRDVNLFQLDESPWVGFANYKTLFAYSFFWNSVQVTLVYAISSVAGAALVGLLLALALNKQTRINSILRAFFIIPWVLPGALVAFLFMYMSLQTGGVIGYFLTKIGLLEKPINFFADLDTALPAVIITTIWMSFPFCMIMFLAGLKTIPREIEEAAVIDGANRFQSFWYITLPYLKSVIVITTTLMVIWNFNFIDIVIVTTQGGPIGKTDILVNLAYRTSIEQLNFSLTSAIGVVWLLSLTGFAYLYLRSMKVLGD